jgi:hypothetical protein
MSVIWGAQITLPIGQSVSLIEEIADLPADGKLKWSTSESGYTSVNAAGTVSAKAAGVSTVTAKCESGNKEYKWKVTTVAPRSRAAGRVTSDLSFLGSDEDIKKLSAAGITNRETLLRCLSERNGKKKLSSELAADEATVNMWERTARLTEIDGVSDSTAYVAAALGIRGAADLANTDVKRFMSAANSLAASGMLKPGVVPPTQQELEAAIADAEEFSRRHPELLNEISGVEPVHLAAAEKRRDKKTDAQILSEGVQILAQLKSCPPLPRTVSGHVTLRRRGKGEYSNMFEDADLIGCKVEMGGVSSPAQDKTENNEDLSNFTGGEGRFAIVMPDRYNVQETISFKISENPDSPEVLARTRVLGGVGARSMTFVRRASELFANSYVTIRGVRWNVSEIFDKINRLEALSKENRELYALIMEEIAEKRRVEEARARREKQLAAIENAEKRRAKALQAMIDKLTAERILAQAEKQKIRAELEAEERAERAGNSEPEEPEEEVIDNVDEDFGEETEHIDYEALGIRKAEQPEGLRNGMKEIDSVRGVKLNDVRADSEKIKIIRDTITEAVGIEKPVYELANPVFEPERPIAHTEQVFTAASGDGVIAEVPVNRTPAGYRPDDRNGDDENDGPDMRSVRMLELDTLSDLYSRVIARLTDRLACVGSRPINFITDDSTFEPTPSYESLKNGSSEAASELDRLAEYEDEFLCETPLFYPAELGFDPLRTEAKCAKKALVMADASLDPESVCQVAHQYTERDEFEEYLKENATDYVPEDADAKSRPDAYVGNRTEIKDILNELGCTETGVDDMLIELLASDLEADMGDFVVLDEAFGEKDVLTRALPSVKLMGEGVDATFLPTDTAPSRLFNYGMVQRLVDPEIEIRGRAGVREKIPGPIDVYDFKKNLFTDPKSAALASSLGMGYILNMHQAWVPDGFALGSMLYSMVLAPGEEQRLIVKEHTENYTVSDMAMAEDTIKDVYSNSQQDNETAAFTNAVDRYSGAHSDYEYYSSASSSSKAGLGFFFGIGAGVSSNSVNRGHGAANSSQIDTYDEVSQAAQSFQSDIKTESERIATAKRVSIRTASSSDSESVASKIIANHNHSHVMTVQYWEVMRRYRMETCIEGIDLLLFVPLKPVCFLPENSSVDPDWAGFTLDPKLLINSEDVTPLKFNYRYGQLLEYADTLMPELPLRYRSGLELIKKYASYPRWTFVPASGTENAKVRLTMYGCFLQCDSLRAKLNFASGRDPIYGRTVKKRVWKIHPSMNTRQDVLYFIEKAREGIFVVKDSEGIKKVGPPWMKKTVSTVDNYYEFDTKETEFESIPGLFPRGMWVMEFSLPASIPFKDIKSIVVENNAGDFNYHLSQDTQYMEVYEADSVKNYEQWLHNYSADDDSSAKDQRRIEHYSEYLPECYTDPLVTITEDELLSLGSLNVSRAKVTSQVYSKEDLVFELDGDPYAIPMNDECPLLTDAELSKMEMTLHHVVANTIRYSQTVWASLSDDERIMLLERYTLDLSLGKQETFNKNAFSEDSVPLLSCVNPKKVIGFYGNCMMLPFTYPESIAKLLGKTAAEVQDELYRYHTTSFRVPSTVVSVATDGMVGEAVLGATNVSEKVDVTRFWNWKDSDIDHMEIGQNSFNNGSSLLANAQTMRVDAPTQGVTPTTHITGADLAGALMSRAQPTFADALSVADIRELLKSADSNASAGREAVVSASTGMVNTAVQAAADVASAYFGGGAKDAVSGAISSAAGSVPKPSGSGGDVTPQPGGDGGDNQNPLTGSDPVKEPGQDDSPENPGQEGEDVGTGAEHVEGPVTPKPLDDDNDKPGNGDEPLFTPAGNGNGESGHTPAEGSELTCTPANEQEERLLRLIDAAAEAIKNGGDPVSFFCEQTGAAREEASEMIEKVGRSFSREFNIDLESLANELLRN